MKANAGFTLIEVAVSLAIISISFVTLIGAFNRANAASAGNAVLTNATMLAQEKLAAATSMEETSPEEPKWEEDARYPRYRYKKTVEQTPFRDVNKVSLAVEYDKKPATRMETYLIRP